MRRRHLRDNLNKSRSDEIDERFTTVCNVRSECELTVQRYSNILTVSESGTAVPERSIPESKGEARRASQALPRTEQDCLRLVWVYGQTIETEPNIHVHG